MRQSFLLIVALLLVGGCSESGVFVVFNAASDVIRVYDGRKWFDLSAGTKIEIHPGRVDEKANFLVEVRGQRFGYEISGIPILDQFAAKKKGRYYLFLQLQPDLNLWLTKPGEVFPVERFVEQPPGFPIAPTRRPE